MNKKLKDLIEELAEEKFSTAQEEAAQGGVQFDSEAVGIICREEAEEFVKKVLAAAELDPTDKLGQD